MPEKRVAEVVWICPKRRVRAWATLARNVKECCVATEFRAHTCYGCPGPIKYVRANKPALCNEELGYVAVTAVEKQFAVGLLGVKILTSTDGAIAVGAEVREKMEGK